MKYEIAIIDSNTLSCIALKGILKEFVPFARINCYSSAREFREEGSGFVVHAFVGAKIFAESPVLKDMLGNRIIVVGESDTPESLYTGYPFLCADQPEKDIVQDFLNLRREGHSAPQSRERLCSTDNNLTVREQEVLTLIVRGFTNKEIAEKLFLSQATVIYHRNNIAIKLGTRSVAKFTIYAVNHGIVGVDEVSR